MSATGLLTWRHMGALATIAAVVLLSTIGAAGARAATTSFKWSPAVAVDKADGFAKFSCESATQCTAITDNMGTVVNFNPAAPGTPTAHAVENSGTPGIHPNSIACPASNQCTVIDQPTGEVTFNPLAPAAPQMPTPIGNGSSLLSGIACPLASQCTVIDNAGNVYTFNPESSSVHPAAVLIDSGNSLNHIACPSAGQCTATDTSGGEVTFDPTAPGHPGRVSLETFNPAGLSCPATNQCTVVDRESHEITFDPTNAHPATATLGGSASPSLGGITCPSTGQCTATGTIDTGNSIFDVEYTFDPGAPGGATNAQFAPQYYPAEGILCPSTSLCYMFTLDGYEFTGSPTSGGGGGHPTPATASVGSVSVSGTTVKVPANCKGSSGSCSFTAKIVLTETVKGGRAIAVSARAKKATKRVLTVGHASITVKAGSSATLKLVLSSAGKKLLKHFHSLKVKLTVVSGTHKLLTKVLKIT